MDYQKTCMVCGKDFIGYSAKASLCSASCKKIRRKATNKNYRKRVMKQLRLMRELSEYVPPDNTLAYINQLARDYGLTYGYYMAYRQRGMIT